MVRAIASNTVLVVEDEPLVRLYAVEYFADVGFTVLEATEASGALRILEMRNDIGAVFTDVNMPGEIDGLALAQRIGTRWPDVAVIVTSGKASLGPDQLPVRGRFIAKPYNAEHVATMILELFV